MQVVVVLEHQFTRTPDGAVWTPTTFPYAFWERYLDVFDGVKIVAGVLEVLEAGPDARRVDGSGVGLAGVPYYSDPWQYLLKARQVRAATRDVVQSRDAVILRLGSPIASQIEPTLRRTHHPYGVEVVSDPSDGVAPGAIKHPLRPFFRWWLTRQQQRQCAHASAVAYATEYSLQRRYPPSPAGCLTHSSNVEPWDADFTDRVCLYPRETWTVATHYADVELPDAAFVSAPRFYRPQQSFHLITVGHLAQRCNALDVLIEAIALCVEGGVNMQLTLVGDGPSRPHLEALVARLGLAERIRFLGELSAGEAVRSHLDQADLFVLPSRQAGLPRSMIEAMARGLPCLGSQRGGMSELLPPADRVPLGDAPALARKIRAVITDPDRMTRMSYQALSTAQGYRQALLRERRIQFYRSLREITAEWIGESHRAFRSPLSSLSRSMEY